MASDGMQLSLVGMGMSARTYGVRADLGGGGVDFEVLGNTQSDPTWRRLFGVDGYGAPPGGNPYDRLKVYDDSGANQKKVWNEGNLPVESGTFTPVLIGDQSNPTVTYQSQQGYYYRIGDLVWFVLYIATSAYSGGAGTLRIDGLPYPGISANPPLTCRPQGVDWGGGAVPYAFVRSGLTQIGFGFLRDSASPVFPPVAAWPNAASIGISGTYRRQP